MKVFRVLFYAGFLSTFVVISSALAEEAKVFVKSVSGEVTLERDRIKSPVAQGAQLRAQDGIKTDKNAVVDIVWDNKWGYRLIGKSHCVLESIDKKSTFIEMKDGNIIFNVKELPPEAILEVSTPTAVAAVRGTQFWGMVDGQASTFAVREGFIMVTVKSSGEVYKLKEGQALDVKKKKAFAFPRTALEAEMNAMKQADDIPVSDVASVTP